MYEEDTERQSRSNCCGSVVADTNMVCSDVADVSEHSLCYKSSRQPINIAVQGNETTTQTFTKFDGMSHIRRDYEKQGISRNTTSILLASWRSGTQKQYCGYIKKWLSYCREKQINQVQASLVNVLDFLTKLFEEGLSYSSLNSARSSLSALGLCCDNIVVGSHPTIIRFMRGVYNLRPQQQKFVHIWDTNMVLCYLRKLSPVCTLALKELTLKLVMLIALTDATRAQSIHMLSVDSMEKLKNEFIFYVNSLIKQSRPRYKNPDIILKSYPPDRGLCVYTVLKEYLKRTHPYRVDTQKLILSYIKPFKPVSTATISRWIKTAMCQSGIYTDIFTAHSTRAASTSKAKNNNVPINEILSRAGWSNVKTFATFYEKKVSSDVFSTNILKC